MVASDTAWLVKPRARRRRHLVLPPPTSCEHRHLVRPSLPVDPWLVRECEACRLVRECQGCRRPTANFHHWRGAAAASPNAGWGSVKAAVLSGSKGLPRGSLSHGMPSPWHCHAREHSSRAVHPWSLAYPPDPDPDPLSRRARAALDSRCEREAQPCEEVTCLG